MNYDPNYNLAKELKDAGFPQSGDDGRFYNAYPSDGGKGASVYYPTLEELIEACGRHDFKLRQTYSAYENKTFYVVEIPGDDDMERCDTPTEAVARLWLALNKK